MTALLTRPTAAPQNSLTRSGIPARTPSPEPAGPARQAGPSPSADEVLAVLGVDRLDATCLDEVLRAASLQTRVDRKYLLDARTAQRLVGELVPTHHVLRIAGRRATTYASQYFDTPHSDAHRAHAQGRRLRWKVRTRLYCEDGLCRLELKTKDQAGRTVKDALDVAPDAFDVLTPQGRAFLRQTLGRRGAQAPVDDLVPGVRIDYARSTLVDLTGGTRLTIDGGLVARRSALGVRLRSDVVLVETKGTARPSGADQVLRDLGVRPVSVSKYGLTASLLDPALPGNRWRRLARAHFGEVFCLGGAVSA